MTSSQVEIEDGTHTGSNKFTISQDSMIKLTDCSKMRTDKQLSKLAKEGVIFLRAPCNDDNKLRSNAINLGNVLMKLLIKYEFIDKIPHLKYDQSVKY